MKGSTGEIDAKGSVGVKVKTRRLALWSERRK